jgi:Flp pilus assembly protein TadG
MLALAFTRSARFSSLWSQAGDECCRGAVAVQVAVLLVAIIGFVSLGSEVVLMLATSRHMQSAADAAALAAVTAVVSGRPSAYTEEIFAMTAAAGFINAATDGTTVAVNRPPATGG